MRAELEINGKMMKVIIDTGAATNVISDNLIKELGLGIEEPSNFRCTMANGTKVASLGKTTIEVGINEELMLPVQVNVLKSGKKELILGNDTLRDMNANIDFEDKLMAIRAEDELIEIPVEYETPKENRLNKKEEIESDYESEQEYEQEYEDDEQVQIYTVMDEFDKLGNDVKWKVLALQRERQ